MKSYKLEELFNINGKLIYELAPLGNMCMSANLHVNSGLLMHDWKITDFTKNAIEIRKPDVMKLKL